MGKQPRLATRHTQVHSAHAGMGGTACTSAWPSRLGADWCRDARVRLRRVANDAFDVNHDDTDRLRAAPALWRPPEPPDHLLPPPHSITYDLTREGNARHQGLRAGGLRQTRSTGERSESMNGRGDPIGASNRASEKASVDEL